LVAVDLAETALAFFTHSTIFPHIKRLSHHSLLFHSTNASWSAFCTRRTAFPS
jgi:hypothetical protein